MKYKHISLQERELICIGVQTGKGYRQIARELHRSHSSIVREIRRNRIHGLRPSMVIHPYLATHAQKKAEKRARVQRQKAPLKCPAIFLYVRKKLRKNKWSPETIAGRLSLEKPGLKIHHETIYRYIYSKPVKTRYKLWECLTLKRNRRMIKGGRSVKRPSKLGVDTIDLRPNEINLREHIGHWETDNMEGIRSDRQAVSVIVERKSRYAHLTQVGLDSQSKAQSVIGRLSAYPKQTTLTLTFDNGGENSHWRTIEEKLGVKSYACHPYHSWEKGTVENTIGRLRRYLPKGQSLKNLTTQQLARIQDQMNHTPRKCLNYQTPHEAMTQALVKLAL